MSHPRKLIGVLTLGLGTLALVALFGFYGVMAGALSFDCSNEVVAEYPSPDSTLKVVVFWRNCGATTGFNTQASVLAIDRDIPDGSGNAFVADTNDGDAPAAPWGGPTLLVQWDRPDTITLEHHEHARIFLSEPRIGRTTIRYVATQ